MAFKKVELDDAQIQMIVNATTEKEPLAGLYLFWAIALGKPLSEFAKGEVKAAEYRITTEAYKKIFQGSYPKIGKMNRQSFDMAWMDIGPGRIV